MQRKRLVYEREIRLAGSVLIAVLLGANVSLFWLSTRLSRRIQSDHAQRLAIIAELAYRQWQQSADSLVDTDFMSRWGLTQVGAWGREGRWLWHSRSEHRGQPVEIYGGLNAARLRDLDVRGATISAVYGRLGDERQIYLLSKERGSVIVAVEQSAALVASLDRFIILQTIFLVLGTAGVLVLFFWYLRMVFQPFRQMARQTQVALGVEGAAQDSEVAFVLDVYQRVLEEMKKQGRSLKDLYDLSRLRAERSERINKHLLESLDKGVAFVDDHGNLISANRAAFAMAGAADLEALGRMLLLTENRSGEHQDQWTVELGQGRKVLQILRSRMEPGGEGQALTMLLITDATLQRRLEEQSSLFENMRLLKASSEKLAERLGPDLDRLQELLEETGAGGREALQRIRKTLEDLSQQWNFSTGNEPEAGDQEILACQPGLARVLEMARKVAATDSTVLLSGESGTGKELLARYIHRISARRDGPFVSINCGALPENLIESELFGYVKGAFTGAYRDKPGLLTAAHGGTFLLDEVGELPVSLQVKLLSVLQERDGVQVGQVKARSIDIRVIAATNRDLERMVKENRFRQDLYFRLNIFPIVVPPLRERKEDIPVLADILIRKIAKKSGLSIKSLDGNALSVLQAYSWPGNVRELENVLERSLVMASGLLIKPEDIQLPETGAEKVHEEDTGSEDLWEVTRRAAGEAERQAIAAALKAAGGNKSEAARRLKISYRVMLKKIKDYQLDKVEN